MDSVKNNSILIVENLNVYSPLPLVKGEVKLLDNINMVISKNDIIGLVGESGSGKTVLINAIGCNLQSPLYLTVDNLSIRLNNEFKNPLEMSAEELRTIRGKAIAFIPSNARNKLNPILTVGKQFNNILRANFQLSAESAYGKVIEMFRLVQMPDAKRNYDNYPHELSGGMAQRVAISIALSMSPTLLLADEPTMGLDVTIQKQVLDLIVKLNQKLRASVILATRDLGIVANYCNRVLVLCNGKLVEFSEKRDFFKNAKHPYSKYLLQSAFASLGKAGKVDFQPMKSRREIIITENGCIFADRCPLAQTICYTSPPPEVSVATNHYVKCHKVKEG